MDKKIQLSKKEIKFLRGLPKHLKFAKWGISILALLCLVIFIQNLYYAEHIGRITGMGGIDSILRSWFNGFDKYRTYTYFHMWVMERITTAFISFIILVILYPVMYYTTKKNGLLLMKLWQLLNIPRERRRTSKKT